MAMKLRHEFPPMLGPAEEASVGSIEWAERISRRLQLATDSLSRDTVHHLQRCIKQIWEAEPRPWEIWPEDRPCGTPDEYCRIVTGHPWKALVALIQEMGEEQLGFTFRDMQAELAKAQAEHRKRGRPKKENSAHGTNLTRGSNKADHLLRRLARDHPIILRRYEKGEFKSVRAAAKAAGLIKEPNRLEQTQKLIARLTKAERRILWQDLYKEFR
jgi:hypothetical protein